jgi:hypothetical protein
MRRLEQARRTWIWTREHNLINRHYVLLMARLSNATSKHAQGAMWLFGATWVIGAGLHEPAPLDEPRSRLPRVSGCSGAARLGRLSSRVRARLGTRVIGPVISPCVAPARL